MTLTLNTSLEVEQHLAVEAERQGISVDEYALQLLEKGLSPAERRAVFLALLQSWIDDGDAEEQKETSDFLIQALDEDRPADQKLFPEGLKGVTW